MSKRKKLLASIANTVSDYRAGELPTPTPDHIDRWVQQFDKAVRLPILSEMDYILSNTYLSKSCVEEFFAYQIDSEKLAGKDPKNFWASTHVLNIQKDGQSQKEIRLLFGSALKKQLGLDVDKCGKTRNINLYLDDFLFSGGRIGNDLSDWIENKAPKECTIHVLVIAVHGFGEWKCKDRLKRVAKKVNKKIELKFWAAVKLENRRMCKNASDVLWPATLPRDRDLREYMALEKKFPFEARKVLAEPQTKFFSSEKGRQLIEKEMLLAGLRIRKNCQSPKNVMRPLGYSPFGLGFGSTIVTYRNCPNNCPLAFWWGDPEKNSGHLQWYPLFARKTYQ